MMESDISIGKNMEAGDCLAVFFQETRADLGKLGAIQ
jgi:hypothetical protein